MLDQRNRKGVPNVSVTLVSKGEFSSDDVTQTASLPEDFPKARPAEVAMPILKTGKPIPKFLGLDDEDHCPLDETPWV